jgi:release factor glutamine methyltransferase
MSTLTLAQAMDQARQQKISRLDAQLLLGHLLAQSRAWLLAHDDAALTVPQQVAWASLLSRRAAGEPVAYLVGEKEFHGLMLRVSPSVLVPRPDTETLVDWGLELLRSPDCPPAPQVIDLGTGSGAIALAIKHERPDAKVTAIDASDDALAVARGNARRLDLDIVWHEGHWWNSVHGQRFNLALSNPPYIAEGDAHLAALQHEPVMALTSGPQGLDALREIVQAAPGHLAPGGWLLLEHGFQQAAEVRQLLDLHGFRDMQTRCDLAGQQRCTGGRLP